MTVRAAGNLVENWTYSYDALDRLTRGRNLGTAAATHDIAYDIGGNITSMAGRGAYVYPAATAVLLAAHGFGLPPECSQRQADCSVPVGCGDIVR